MSSTIDVLRAGAWSRMRRIAWTGENNPAFKHGRYTNRRRWKLEKPLNEAMAELTSLPQLDQLQRTIALLPDARRHRARTALDELGKFMPVQQWAMPYQRRGQSLGWYLPRCAWAHCAKFLRAFAALKRLVFFGTSLIRWLVPTPYRERNRKSDLGRGLNTGSGHEARKQTELRRFADYCARHGLSTAP
jgi:hypothetical protein